jgi:hypothetical protein
LAETTTTTKSQITNNINKYKNALSAFDLCFAQKQNYLFRFLEEENKIQNITPTTTATQVRMTGNEESGIPFQRTFTQMVNVSTSGFTKPGAR